MFHNDNSDDISSSTPTQTPPSSPASVKYNKDNMSECEEQGNAWSLDDGLRYTVSLVTTIGYGDLAPKTQDGRLVTIFVGGLGIPLAFAAFLKCGKIAAYLVLCIYTQILACGLCKSDKEEEEGSEMMNGMNTITSRASIYTNRQVSRVEVKKVRSCSVLRTASKDFAHLFEEQF